jgi:hypothetical protein
MISIEPSAIEQQTLRVGSSVMITAGDGGCAIVETFDDTAVLAPVRLASSQSQSFGPYNKDMRFRVSAIADRVTWADVSTPSQSGWSQGSQGPSIVTLEALAPIDGAQTLALPSPYSTGWFQLCVNGLRQLASQYSVSGSTLTLPDSLHVMTGDQISFDFYP